MSKQAAEKRVEHDHVVDSVRAHAGLPEETGSKTIAASAGVLAGGAVGAFAGPIGIVAGSVIGAVAGAAVGAALEEHAKLHARAERKLDEAMGVMGGNMGVARPGGPPTRSTRGTFSGSSVGVGGTGASQEDAPDEGPIPRGS